MLGGARTDPLGLMDDFARPPRYNRHMRRVAVVCLFTSACSWIAVPSVRTTGEYRDDAVASSCTDSSAAPSTDMVMAVLGGLLAINALVQLQDDGPAASDDPGIGKLLGIAAGVPGALMLPLYGLSAHHGFRHVGRCRAELAKPARQR